MPELGRRCPVVHVLPVSLATTWLLYDNIECLSSARRNAQGHLEPDAPDDVVQASQGFADYEHAPKVEDRK